MERLHAVLTQTNRKSQIKNEEEKNYLHNSSTPKLKGTRKIPKRNSSAESVDENLLYNECSESSEATFTIFNESNCTASQDILDESHRLYQFHFTREFMLNEIATPNYILCETYPLHLRALVTLADRFRVSPQRQSVYDRAQTVNLETLNLDTFQNLLDGLFQEGGVTWERVLVLFFFCTDLAARAFRERLIVYFCKINQWSWRYVRNSLSIWVEENGGWGEVLSDPGNRIRKYAFFTLCCIGIIGAVLYVRNWKK